MNLILQRWIKISKDLNMELKSWRLNQKEGHILICCQRDGGWSMDGRANQEWLREVIPAIRMRTRGLY